MRYPIIFTLPATLLALCAPTPARAQGSVAFEPERLPAWSPVAPADMGQRTEWEQLVVENPTRGERVELDHVRRTLGYTFGGQRYDLPVREDLLRDARAAIFAAPGPAERSDLEPGSSGLRITVDGEAYASRNMLQLAHAVWAEAQYGKHRKHGEDMTLNLEIREAGRVSPSTGEPVTLAHRSGGFGGTRSWALVFPGRPGLRDGVERLVGERVTVAGRPLDGETYTGAGGSGSFRLLAVQDVFVIGPEGQLLRVSDHQPTTGSGRVGTEPADGEQEVYDYFPHDLRAPRGNDPARVILAQRRERQEAWEAYRAAPPIAPQTNEPRAGITAGLLGRGR